MTAIPPAHTDVGRRHDFVLFFDVQDGNPNGDPDAGNFPRVDPETMQGLVTDVSLKRRVRDWVDALSMDRPRYKIYVQRESYLTETRSRVFEEQARGREGVRLSEAQQWMCQEFFDVRLQEELYPSTGPCAKELSQKADELLGRGTRHGLGWGKVWGWMLDGIIFRMRSGCQWKRLPRELGDDSTIHRTFQRWVEPGVLEGIWAVLVEGGEELGGVTWE